MSEKLMFPFFHALYNHSQVSIVALWATCLEFEVDYSRLFCSWKILDIYGSLNPYSRWRDNSESSDLDKVDELLKAISGSGREDLALDLREKYCEQGKTSLVLRKRVFWVSDQVRHKSCCTAAEDG